MTLRSTVRALPAMLMLMVLVLVLAGCAARSPEPRTYRLPSAAPEAIAAAPVAAADAWQLMAPLRVPAYLDVDALQVPRGATGLQPLPLDRWAEPLRDAVARVLVADLTVLRGGVPVWRAPLPAGAAAAWQLRVELLAFEATPDRRAVHLQARWSLADGAGRTAPREQTASIDAPSTDPSPDALVAAHRLALWRLAQRIAATP